MKGWQGWVAALWLWGMVPAEVLANPIAGNRGDLSFLINLELPVVAQENNEDRQDRAYRLLSEGVQLLQASEFQAAREKLYEALAIYREIGDRFFEGVTLTGLGEVSRELGRYSLALEYSQEALAIHQEVENPLMEGTTLSNLGGIYSALGDYPQALEYYQQALAIHREAGHRFGEGVVFNSLGLIHHNLGDYPTALEYFEQALSIRQEIGHQSGVGITLNNLGLLYASLGNYPQALEYYQQALTIVREVGDRTGVGTTLNNLGGVYESLGDYPQALEYYQQALTIAREIGNRARVGMTLNNLGLIYNNLGDYSQALEYYQQALTIAREIGNRSGEGTTLNNFGSVYFQRGDYPQALEYYQQALTVIREIGDRAGVGITLNNLGFVYKKLGNYPLALENHQQALEIAREIGDRAGESVAFKALGEIYSYLGNERQALEYYQQALTIARDIGYRAAVGTILKAIGGVYLRLGNYSQALEYYQQALAIVREIGERSIEGRTLSDLGTIHTLIDRSTQALEYYQQALVIAREIGDRSGEGADLSGLGLAYMNLGNFSQALEYYRQALDVTREIGDRIGESTTLSGLGFVYGHLREHAEAERWLFEAIAVWESLRSSELSDTDKISLFDTHTFAYQGLQQALIAQNKTEIALEVAERGRARAFVDVLWQRFSDDTRSTVPPPTLDDIRQVAREQNATFVEYSVIEDDGMARDLYIWVISPTGNITFRSLSLAEIDLEALVHTTRFSMGVRDRVAIQVVRVDSSSERTARLQQLHQLLIEPIADLLPQSPAERVVFVPHGALFLVPFAALQDTDETYLIDKHTILTAPAIQVLQLAGNRVADTSGGEALVVGNPTMPSIQENPADPPIPLRPLPGAETEAKAIAQMLGTEPLLGNAATEPTVVERMQTASIIHLATHGLLDDTRGIYSSIALTPGDGRDGFLTAGEIFDLNLNAELVVLSACDTGRGDITGDGVVGLSRSLVTAGAHSVVASLWQVPDAPTAELMTEFYDRLQQGLDKATALRNAMLSTRETHPEPSNWAAFTLMGEADAMQLTTQQN